MKEEYFANYIRATAMLMVVFFHTLEVTAIDTTFSNNLFFVLYSIHVPAFLMVSGFLFRGTMRRHTALEIIWQKIMDLGIVFVEWSIMYTIYNLIIFYLLGSPFASLYKCIAFSINNVWYLWFLLFCSLATFITDKLRLPKPFVGIILFIGIWICAMFSVGLTKMATHFLIFWLGYCFKEIGVYFYRMSAVLYIPLTIGNGLYRWFDTGTVIRGGIEMAPVMMYKILGGAFLFMLFYDMCRLFPMVNCENFITRMGGKTLYMYILHFIPLAIYRCIGASTWGAVFVGAGLFVVFTLLIERLIKGTMVDRMLFHPAYFITKK